jgi:hypothetical protein
MQSLYHTSATSERGRNSNAMRGHVPVTLEVVLNRAFRPMLKFAGPSRLRAGTGARHG